MRDCPVSPVLLAGLALLAACGGEPDGITFDLADRAEPDLGPSPDLSIAAGPQIARCTGKGGTPGDHELMIRVGNDDRRYLLHVPPGYDAETPTPLVVAYHGVTESPESMRDKSHFSAVADERGFLVAYPAGRFEAWNGGACCGLARATMVDDVGFSRALVATLVTDYCVDEKRIYASGFSNGGFMTHRVGCEMADVYAAIGVVAGQESMATCAPGRAVPVVQVHGTTDPLVPYNGNPILGFPSTQATIDGWASRDGCTTGPSVIGTWDGVSCVQRGGCNEGAEVVLCTHGGQHDWIGGGSAWTAAGPPPGFVTTTYFADFFAKHPMP